MGKPNLVLVDDYDFDPEDISWAEKRVLVIPPEVEILRNKMGDRVLKGYAKNFTGKSHVELVEIFYNRDWNLTIEVNLS